jgi:hypothetical protein
MPEKPANRNVKKVESLARQQRHDSHIQASAKLRKQTISFKRRPGNESDLDSQGCSKEELASIITRCAVSPEVLTAPNEHLVFLRKALSTQDDELIDHAIGLGVVPLLMRYMESCSCACNQVEAVWCITNISSGLSSHTQAVLGVAPILVQLLEIDNNVLQEQCVWALGNMARGPDARVEELLAAGAGEALTSVVVREDEHDEDLLVEALWALTYLTHQQVTYFTPQQATAAWMSLVRARWPRRASRGLMPSI